MYMYMYVYMYTYMYVYSEGNLSIAIMDTIGCPDYRGVLNVLHVLREAPMYIIMYYIIIISIPYRVLHYYYLIGYYCC